MIIDHGQARLFSCEGNPVLSLILSSLIVLPNNFLSLFYCKVRDLFELLRYDLIDRPGVLGNYVPLNYHCLYDLSVLVLRAGIVPTLNMNAIRFYLLSHTLMIIDH